MHLRIFTRLFRCLAAITVFGMVFHMNSLAQDKSVSLCAEADYDCWIVEFSRSIESNSKDKGAYLGRGYAYMQKKRFAEALFDFKRAKEIEAENSNVVLYLEYVSKVAKRGDLPDEEYDKLIQLEPTNADFYYGRAFVQYKLKNYDSAVEGASAAIKLNPKLVEAYAVRSDSYCKLGKREESNADIAKYERLTGKDSKAECRYCASEDYSCRIRDVTEEIVSVKKQLTTNKDIHLRLNVLYAIRASLYLRMDDFISALRDYNEILKTSRSVSILSAVADIYLRLGKDDEALTIFDEILSKDPNSYKTLVKIAPIYLAKRDYEKALETYDSLIFLNSNSEFYLKRAEIYLYLAKSYEETEAGKSKAEIYYKKVLSDLNETIKESPKTVAAKVYLKRAEVLEKLGEIEKAEADRAKAEELSEKP